MPSNDMNVQKTEVQKLEVQKGKKIKLALIVNPWSGVGGEIALKGSDGKSVRDKAISEGVKPKALERVKQFFGKPGSF